MDKNVNKEEIPFDTYEGESQECHKKLNFFLIIRVTIISLGGHLSIWEMLKDNSLFLLMTTYAHFVSGWQTKVKTSADGH